MKFKKIFVMIFARLQFAFIYALEIGSARFLDKNKINMKSIFRGIFVERRVFTLTPGFLGGREQIYIIKNFRLFMDLKDKIVLITGSSQGIGKETAILFAKEGANVVVTYNSSKKKAEEVFN